MKEKLYRFMVGRNGNDELNCFLLLVCVIVMLPAMFFSKMTGISSGMDTPEPSSSLNLS